MPAPNPTASATPAPDEHWVAGVANEILRRNDERIVIHTGKTPSGPIHIGAEREQFICSAVQRELRRRGYDSTFNFIIDSFDPLKSIPAGVQVPKGFEDHIGSPLSDVPDPFGCHESYAVHFAQEFVDCQGRLGLSPNVIYSHKLYETDAMKDAIRTVLRKIDELREIRGKYIRVQEEDGSEGGTGSGSGSGSGSWSGSMGWNPVMVVCERCGKIACRRKDVEPNRITSWDLARDEATFACTSCGCEGKGKIRDLRLKLSWRVDWAAKWAVFRVTCEPAGKDHCVRDGAYDMGLEVCDRIFGYRGPIRVPYEWLTLGEHAMKTHKGITFTPREWLKIAPPESMRYLILSADLMRHIAFLPERVPDIVDGFDRLERAYFGSEEPPGGASRAFVNRLYEICSVGEPFEELPVRLPYRFAVYMVQLESLLGRDKVLSKSIGYALKLYDREALTDREHRDLEERLSMAKNWVLTYAPQNLKFQIAETPYRPSSEAEKSFVRSIIDMLGRDLKEEDLQNEIFSAARSLGLGVGEAFSVIYRILLGSERGPRLAPLLIALDRDWTIRRLNSVLQPPDA